MEVSTLRANCDEVEAKYDALTEEHACAMRCLQVGPQGKAGFLGLRQCLSSLNASELSGGAPALRSRLSRRVLTCVGRVCRSSRRTTR